MPAMPPTAVMVIASARNCKRMSRRRPPSAERQGADEAQQDLQAHGDDLELLELLHHVEDVHGALVLGLEVVLLGQHAAHLPLDLKAQRSNATEET